MGFADLLPPELQSLAVHDGFGRWVAEQFPTALSAEYRASLHTALKSEDPLVREVALERITAYAERGVETQRVIQNDRDLMTALLQNSTTSLQDRVCIAPPIQPAALGKKSRITLRDAINTSLDEFDIVTQDGTLFRFGYKDAIRDQLERIAAVRSITEGLSDSPDPQLVSKAAKMLVATFDSLRNRLHSAYFWRGVIAPAITGGATLSGLSKGLYSLSHSIPEALTTLPVTIGFIYTLIELGSCQRSDKNINAALEADSQIRAALKCGLKYSIVCSFGLGLFSAFVEKSAASTLANVMLSTSLTLATYPVFSLYLRFARKRVHAELLKTSAALNTCNLSTAIEESENANGQRDSAAATG